MTFKIFDQSDDETWLKRSTYLHTFPLTYLPIYLPREHPLGDFTWDRIGFSKWISQFHCLFLSFIIWYILDGESSIYLWGKAKLTFCLIWWFIPARRRPKTFLCYIFTYKISIYRNWTYSDIFDSYFLIYMYLEDTKTC